MIQIYNKNSNLRQNKRRLASCEGAQLDLKKELPKMFKAFTEAKEQFNNEVNLTPPEARARGFEASLLNSKMIQSIQKYFPHNWKYGKYKRFTLQINGYIILFKKLDRYNKPMNIKTKSVEAISQQLSLPLFNETNFVEEPILFFGYKKNGVGNISEPKLVYLDEGQVQWSITEKDITTLDHVVEIHGESKKIATPRLKKNKQNDRKVS